MEELLTCTCECQVALTMSTASTWSGLILLLRFPSGIFTKMFVT